MRRSLRAAGHNVVAMDVAGGGEGVERGSVDDLHTLIRLVKKYRVDALVHLAGILGGSSEDDPLFASRINVLGTLNVFEATRLCEVRRVVTASSMVVFGSDSEYGGEITDDSPK